MNIEDVRVTVEYSLRIVTSPSHQAGVVEVLQPDGLSGFALLDHDGFECGHAPAPHGFDP